jgi:hypothetical protein
VHQLVHQVGPAARGALVNGRDNHLTRLEACIFTHKASRL